MNKIDTKISKINPSYEMKNIIDVSYITYSNWNYLSNYHPIKYSDW